MTTFDIGGKRLEVVERGAGEPLVFVHGSASDYRTWQSQLNDSPEANHGPLLGIFITGPRGFLLGAVGGLVWWRSKGRGQDRH